MRPNQFGPQMNDMFRFPLRERLNARHERGLLGQAMEWSEIEKSFSAHFASSTDKAIVDTTVLPKAVAHPTDSRLLEKSRQHLLELAADNSIDLMHRVKRILAQTTRDKNKLYVLHAPDVLAQRTPHTVIVDRGYKGAELDGIRILRSAQNRGVSRTLHAMIKRRSAIEPTIGRMKTDGRLARNPLKGALGDALHAML